MRLARFIGVPIVLTVALTLGGCAGLSEPTVGRPRLTAEQEALAQAAQKFLPAGAKITTPLTTGGVVAADGTLSGDGADPSDPTGPSAYLQADIDGDGAQEWVVLYRDGTALKVGALFLKRVGDAWQSLGSIEGQGRDVDLAVTADLFGGGAPALLFGMTSPAGLSSQLDVYRWQDGQERSVASIAYTDAALGDLNGDGRPEIVTTDLTRVGPYQAPGTAVEVLAGTAEGLRSLGKDTVDGYPDALLVGQAASGRPGIFVETMLGAHSGCTQLFFLGEVGQGNYGSQGDQTGQGGGLVRAFPDPYAVTFKPYPLPSADVDGDGIVEIGGMIQPPGSEDLPMVDVPWIETWQRWDGAQGLGPTLLERYVDGDAGYQFDIPANWVGKFTVRKESDLAPEAEFLYVDEAGRTLAPLLTIRQYARSAWGQAEKALAKDKVEYVVLAQPGDQVLVGVLPGDAAGGQSGGQSGDGQAGLSDAAKAEYQGLRLENDQVTKLFRLTPD